MLRVTKALLRAGGAKPNRADRGLYAGRRITFGFSRCDDKKTPTKAPRRWNPNVQTKKFYSPLLDETLKVQVTAHALRCIDKAGGFDEYILHTKPSKLDSKFGIELRAELRERRKLAKIMEAADSGGSGAESA